MSEVAFQLLSWALDDGDESLHKLEYIYNFQLEAVLTWGTNTDQPCNFGRGCAWYEVFICFSSRIIDN